LPVAARQKSRKNLTKMKSQQQKTRQQQTEIISGQTRFKSQKEIHVLCKFTIHFFYLLPLAMHINNKVTTTTTSLITGSSKKWEEWKKKMQRQHCHLTGQTNRAQKEVEKMREF